MLFSIGFTELKMGDSVNNGAATDSQSGFLKSHTLTILTLVCAVSGFATGQAIRHAGWSEDVDRYIDIPGQMILHCYSMLLVPVLFCGIILGVASLHRTSCQRVVVFSAMFFILMMAATSIFSCVLAKALRLGHHVKGFSSSDDNSTDLDDTETVINSMVDFFQNAVPENIIMATFIQKETITRSINMTTPEGNGTVVIDRYTEYKYQTNYVGLVFFCIVFGSTMALLGNKVQTLYMVLDEINLVIMKLLQFLVKLLPIGLFFWLCCQGMITESIVDVFSRMGFYVTVFISVQLGYHFFVLPFLYLVIVRKNPLTFMMKICPLSMMAFGSSSSQACLPLSLKIMEDGLQCHPFVTRFVLPLGSLINKQGATLATPLTVFFIAGLQGVKIGLVKTIVLGVSNVLLQMAFPGIPGNGMTTLWFLYFVGIVKPYVIGLVLSVEWFLDRIITVNNVTGNCYVAAFVDKLCYSLLTRCRQSEAGNSFLIDTGSLSSIATDTSVRTRSRGPSLDTLVYQNSVY